MFFTASKLVWFVAAPTNAFILSLIVAPVLGWMGFRRSGLSLAALATILLVVAGLSPAGTLLLRPLEDRFPQTPADLPSPTGIIVLGGSTDEVVSDARDQVTISAAATRVTEAVVLSRRYPEARLVFSGGSGALFLHPRTEAALTRTLWIAMGVAPERITIEDRSRNTYENALYSKRVVAPKPGERWLLVTSAFHMPRAVGTFRGVGFPVTAYPVDFRTTGGPFDYVPRPEANDGLRRFDIAVKEWIGLAAYAWTGRVSALFPAP